MSCKGTQKILQRIVNMQYMGTNIQAVFVNHHTFYLRNPLTYDVETLWKISMGKNR